MFVLLPCLVIVPIFAVAIHHDFAFDYHIFWTASRRLFHGQSLYPDPRAVALSTSPVAHHDYFVYPPLVAVIFAPLAVLPFSVAAALDTVVALACLAGSLRVLSVRDWRCYGLAAGSIPVISSIRLGAITPFLCFACAMAWRYRDRPLIAGAAVGLAVFAKLFLWPLVVWLIVTRRWRAAFTATVGTSIVTAIVWSAIEFRGLREYPALLRSLTDVEANWSFSLLALTTRLSLPEPRLAALALGVLLGGALLATCYPRRRAGFDERVFVTTIGLSLLLTPILWLHYFALLVVPIALVSPTIGIEWGMLLAFWISPFQQPSHFASWRLLIALGLVLTVVLHARGRARSAPA